MKRNRIQILCVSFLILMSLFTMAQNTENVSDDKRKKWIELAGKGDVSAMIELGKYYGFDNANKDEELSLYNFQRAAQKGSIIGKNMYEEKLGNIVRLAKRNNATAQYTLGLWYRSFWNFGDKDYEKSIEWLHKAKRNGIDVSDSILLCAYSDLRDEKILSKYAKKGESLAQYSMGLFYDERNKRKNYTISEEGRIWYEKSANQGYAPAQYKMGLYYFECAMSFYKSFENKELLRVGSYKETLNSWITETINWWIKAANQEYAVAAFEIGEIYSKGEVIEKDTNTAMKWYEKAGNMGYWRAQWILGRYYYHGEGVEKDVSKAIYWFEKAAEQDVRDAQLILGDLYYSGKEVAQNYEKAFYWYNKCSKAYGIQILYAYKAKCKLGIMYYYGYGCKNNPQKAFALLKEASDSFVGSGDACRVLSACYRYGIGTEVNIKMAEFWLSEAANRRDDKALEVTSPIDYEH